MYSDSSASTDYDFTIFEIDEMLLNIKKLNTSRKEDAFSTKRKKILKCVSKNTFSEVTAF